MGDEFNYFSHVTFRSVLGYIYYFARARGPVPLRRRRHLSSISRRQRACAYRPAQIAPRAHSCARADRGFKFNGTKMERNKTVAGRIPIWIELD